MNSDRKFKNCYLGLLGGMVHQAQSRRGSSYNLSNLNESPTFKRKFSPNSPNGSRNKPRPMWSFERDQLRQNQQVMLK